MRKKNIYMIMLSVLMLCSACNYLDIVPEERATEEDSYSTPQRMKEFLGSCYGYLPNNRQFISFPYWISCAEETSYFRKEEFSTFNEGDYGPTKLHMTSNTWSTVWQGIAQCYRFLDALDKAPAMPDLGEEELKHFRAEAKFLIAYYHFLSLRSYGPTMIIRKVFTVNTPVSEYPERSSYDEVVEFIDGLLEEAIPGLAEQHDGTEYGRVTKYTALALRSRMYLYAASPLYNGNDWYQNFKSPVDGRNLISQEYNEQKWEKAAKTALDAITALEKANFRLYGINGAGQPSLDDAGKPSSAKPGISNMAERNVRYCILDTKNGDNPEVIWCDTRKEGNYGIQRRSMPLQKSGYVVEVSGCICPTFQSVERFYTKNGLPMEYDKTFDGNPSYDRYAVVNVPINIDGNGYSNSNLGMKTMQQHLNREPRFYANIGFHGGYSEIARYNNTAPGKNDADRAIVLNFLFGKDHGRKNVAGTPQDANYSVTGYNNKKFCHPAFNNGVYDYPLPLFRLTELYLNYAEALVELKKFDEAKVALNKVRRRAGIPDVEDAWNNYSTNPSYDDTYEGMQSIVRRERMLELYLEGHQFFDIRRWKIAEQFLGIPVKGLNTLGETEEKLFQVVELSLQRKFHKGQYLMPIPFDDVQKIPQVIQNPYYD